MRFLGTALGLFGGLTVLLAIVGIFGVVSRFVVTRTREIGIRIALGADSARVCRLVVGQTLTAAVVGVCLGLAVAYWWSSVLRTVLAKIDPHDALSFAIAAAAIIVVALAGSAIPVRRAARLDPAVTLRHD